jgi:hypothetical protein
MAHIPKHLHEPINTAWPANVCLLATVLADGFAQVSPRGSVMVFDDSHLAFWERGKGSTNAQLEDGSRLTIFFRSPQLRSEGILPKGGIARFYGRAVLHRSGQLYEEIWRRVIEAEKKGDPERKGFAVLMTVERAEDLSGAPLS